MRLLSLAQQGFQRWNHAHRWEGAGVGVVGVTSLAIVVMKAGGRAVAMRDRAWRAERAESAGGLSGSPMVMLQRDGGSRSFRRYSPQRTVTSSPGDQELSRVVTVGGWASTGSNQNNKLVITVIFGTFLASDVAAASPAAAVDVCLLLNSHNRNRRQEVVDWRRSGGVEERWSAPA